MPSLLLTRATSLRRDVAELSALAAGDLDVMWAQIDSPRVAREALRDILPELVETYGSAASTLAADWYDEVRDELAIDGRFGAIPHDLGNTKTDGLARWAVDPLFAAEPDWARARVLVEGGLQNRIANAARYTIAGSAVADPQARGWQRVGAGACKTGFCDMLIARGAVYSEASARFAAHDHCQCSAVPAFGGQPLPVAEFTPSPRNISDADRARAREWIAENV